jgi:hypothetical protein
VNLGVCGQRVAVRNGKFCVEKGQDSSLRVPEEFLKCVGFIGEVSHTDAEGRDHGDLHATGFFVGVPAQSPELSGDITLYFVTAKHVAVDLAGRTVYFLVNGSNGGVTFLRAVYGNKWWLHPTDPTADLALIPVSREAHHDIRAVHLSNMGTPEKLAELGIGIGDEVFAAGLFTPAAGTDRNIPIVRHGNIAMMPEEQIQTDLGYADVYLVEARSLGGLSGSPVFVRPTIRFTGIKNSQGLDSMFGFGHGLTLLGLMHGHWDIKESEMNKPFFTHDRKHGVNYGIAIVVPAYKIVETLNHPELVKLRKEAEERVIREKLPGPDSNKNSS